MNSGTSTNINSNNNQNSNKRIKMEYQSKDLSEFLTRLNFDKPQSFVAYSLKYFSDKAVKELDNSYRPSQSKPMFTQNTNQSSHRGSIFKSPFVDSDPHSTHDLDIDDPSSAGVFSATSTSSDNSNNNNDKSGIFKGGFNVGSKNLQSKEAELDPMAPAPTTHSASPHADKKNTGANDHSNGGNKHVGMPSNFNAQRRTSVSGETIKPDQDSHDLKEIYANIAKNNNKTEEQLRRLGASVGENFLFKKLDNDSKNLVISALTEKKIGKNETIIKQGDEGDYFYIVESGQVEFYVNGNKVNTSGPGSSFGELALMYNSPRAATVIASTDCILWCLDRLTFRKILLGRSFAKRLMYDDFLKNLPILSKLSTYDRAKLADALNTEFYNKGDVIIKEGDSGENFYFIEYGSALVLKEGEPKPLATLTTGGYFGEIALLNDLPRQATVMANEDTKVVTLGKSGFQRLLGPCVDVLKLHDPTRK